ncbi:sulfur oxidation c-type cytochrome SoxX [Acidithiobacillus montserratensis]|uniref:Sulfur oxidation c-type cytochrome SoxX n=1 Tax=Acidithiobacillus montserratensis TaxID=2729135 RepID=A0ACD5HIB8_9PROT|nr:sulfur oxidation c-type cytochrome SoxX [Acidithiobacillus montserratensis]MBN2679544.1 sulfur oxidation c-type cytochrome SoxX [Acidithiobacillaceae bacterium]MBU2748187.1 sulfur oxidation c-type cytochrome SoxX [Acidithiobacillus montserratensis]
MKHRNKQLAQIALLIAGLAGLTLSMEASAADTPTNAGNIQAGKAIAFNRAQGNCLACHALPGGTMAGNVGPALPMKGVTFQQMFQTKEKLVAFLGDPEKLFPYANMPEFGKNKVLTQTQLEQVADYLWSLK